MSKLSRRIQTSRRRRPGSAHSASVEACEPRMLLSATVQEDFRVPDVVGAFNNLQDTADLLAANYLDAESVPGGFIGAPANAPKVPRNGKGPNTPVEAGENTSDEHFQGIVRSFGTGTGYLYAGASGSKLDNPDDFPNNKKSPEPRGNILVLKMSSAAEDGERLGSNRFDQRVDNAAQSPFDNPPPEDRVINNIFFDDYGHVGGLDTSGEIMAVSLERPLKKVGSRYRTDTSAGAQRGSIQFFDTSDPANPTRIRGVEVIPSYFSNRDGDESGEAGVVALTRLDDGTFLLALSAKNGVDVLFYRSNGTDFHAPGFNFGPKVRESGAPYDTTRPFDVLRASGQIDVRTKEIGRLKAPWPVNYKKRDLQLKLQSIPNSHQSLNFVTQTDGQLYMIGSRNDCGGSQFICPAGDDPDDLLDLYQVQYTATAADAQLGEVTLRHRGTREFETKEGHFAHVGGSHVTPTGELLYYSGDGYNDNDNGRIDIGEIRSTTLTTAGDSAIRGIVATTKRGVLTKTTRSGGAEFLEAGDARVVEEKGELILQVPAGETVTFDASVMQAWIEFYDESSARTNKLLVEVDDRDSPALFDFKKVNDTNRSELNDDAEYISYWLPRGTMVSLYEDDIFDTKADKTAHYNAPSLFNLSASDIRERVEIQADVRDEITAMQFRRAGQFDLPNGWDVGLHESLTTANPRFEWSSVVTSGKTSPIESLLPSGRLDDQRLSVAFDESGRQVITFRYLPAGGLLKDTKSSTLRNAGFPAPFVFGQDPIVPSDWAELTITVDVLAANPTADAGGDYTVDEGGVVRLDGSGSSDPNQPSDSLRYQWDLDGDGRFGEKGPDAARGDELGIRPTFSAAGYDGEDKESVALKVTDATGRTDISTATVFIENVAPVITSLQASEPRPDFSPVTITGSFVDFGGENERHRVEIDWGDGRRSQATVDSEAGTFTGQHIYPDPGVFEVTVSVNDRHDTTTATTDVLSAGVAVIDRVLYAVGTGENDIVGFKYDKKAKRVRADARLGVTADGSGERHRFMEVWDAAEIDSVAVLLGRGDDEAWTNMGKLRLPTRIDGGDGNDRLIGGNGPNTIDGGAGDDNIRTGRSADTISDPSGNNTIKSGAGDDVITTGDGRDNIAAGGGHDRVESGGSADKVKGGGGNDTVFGGDGDDKLSGQRGADQLDGGSGRDQLVGAGGADVLRGGDDNDTIKAGSGNDVLEGGAGNDLLISGSGGDTMQGGDGNDALRGEHGFDVLFGGPGNDILEGGDHNDQLDGGPGDDRLWGGDGEDLLEGGAGNDLLEGGMGHDLLRGGADDDELLGQDGRDVLIGGPGADQLSGGNSDDIVMAGSTTHQTPTLQKILEQWAGSQGYSDRVAGIRSVYFNGSAVQDDADVDTLIGDGGVDWFFASVAADSLADRELFEELDILN